MRSTITQKYLQAAWRRSQQVLRLLRCAVLHWLSDQASSIGAALAFYCAFSLAPLLVILVSCLGWMTGAERAYGYLESQLTALFGHSTAVILLMAMKSSQTDGGMLATSVSIASLFIGATSVFSALQSALQQIFGGSPEEQGGVWAWIRTRILSFGLIMAVGFLLLVSLTISTAVAALRNYLPDSVTAWLVLMSFTDFLISVTLVTLMIALIYRFMPSERLPWRPVWIGSIATAMLFQLGRWVVGLYLARSTQPSAFGAAASFAALLLWLYYTAQIFLFGAEFTACLSGHRTGYRQKGEEKGRAPMPIS